MDHILVALDASHRAQGVFEAAVEIATQFKAELHLLRVVSVPPEFPAAAAGSGPDTLGKFLRNKAVEELAEFIAQAPHVSFGAPIVRQGEPWRVILEASEELEVDLIVLGSHGYKGLDRLLGTTAAKAVNMALRNVLVVHARLPVSGGGPKA